MIPKIIHYCWFGGNKKPELILEYINTWKKHCPEYTIVEWNENNFDVNLYRYTQQAYYMKKWAFVSDVARLYALYTCGGIYMDTDVEMLRPIDSFLINNAFTGFESKDCPVTAVVGCEKNNPVIKSLLDYYNDVDFIDAEGKLNMKSNTRIITEILTANGIKPNGKQQNYNGMEIYPQVFFCPNSFSMLFDIPSKKSFTIHHSGQSNNWSESLIRKQPFSTRLYRYLVGLLRNTIGTDRVRKLFSIISRFKK